MYPVAGAVTAAAAETAINHSKSKNGDRGTPKTAVSFLLRFYEAHKKISECHVLKKPSIGGDGGFFFKRILYKDLLQRS